MEGQVVLRLPANTDYINVVRLAVSGMAGRLDYTIDEIEDLKSCVSEACILLLCGQKCSRIEVCIEEEESIKICVDGIDVQLIDNEECVEFNSEISRIMIKSLSDNVSFVEKNDMLYSISFEKRRRL